MPREYPAQRCNGHCRAGCVIQRAHNPCTTNNVSKQINKTKNQFIVVYITQSVLRITLYTIALIYIFDIAAAIHFSILLFHPLVA